MPATRPPGRWIIAVWLLGLAAILFLRLTPFDFIWGGRIPFERATWQPLTTRDIPLNILIFIPFGFGLSGVLARRGRQLGAGGLVLAAGLLLSALLEAAQLFMPERAPSLADVLASGAGSSLGYGLYRVWQMGFRQALDRYATRRNLMAGLAVYVVGAALLTASLYRSARLDNWDASFPLVVGNEAVGKRQWSGWVREVWLEAESGGRPEYTAYYDFSGDAPFASQWPNSAATPPLDWREGPASLQGDEGVRLGPGEWLATRSAFSEFVEAARRTDEITIRMTVATADPKQRGPARIVSISADAERRNITLGQERDALIIRLRTPASGENGQKPEILVPGVFADGEPRNLTIRYDAPWLSVRVDEGEAYRLSLAPGLAFFPGFTTENRYPVSMAGNSSRYDQAYWFILIGVGVILFGGPAAAKRLTARRDRPRQAGRETR